MITHLRLAFLGAVIPFLAACNTTNPFLVTPLLYGAADASSQKILVGIIAHDRKALVAAGVKESDVDKLLQDTAACTPTAKPFFESDSLFASFYIRQYGLGLTKEAPPQVVVSIWFDVDDNMQPHFREIKVVPTRA